jgi:hypothetical protein
MNRLRLDWVLAGAALLVLSCGGGGGQSTDGGSGGAQTGTGGGHGGSGGAGGQAAGTGGSGAGCPSVSPCGGNIVGTWKVTQSCVTATDDLSNTGSGCPGASAVLDFMYGGTITYNADQTFNSTITVSEVTHEHFPSGCMPFGLTCQQLGQSAMDAGVGSCSTDAQGGCTCDATTTLATTTPNGTYSVSGSRTTTTSAAGKTSTGSYCVQGNVLYVIPDPGDGGLTATGEIVLAKQ